MESDEGTRDIGRMLTTILGDKTVLGVISELTKKITQPLLAALMNVIISQVPKALQCDKDDILFAHSHSGFEFDSYGCEPDRKLADFNLGNDLANCTLRIRIND